MATWITHLMIADGVLAHLPALHRCGFCVGNIAPDCNVENENWTAFTPAREVTHWMQGKRKTMADAEAFRDAYIQKYQEKLPDGEEYAFFLGYYAHLLTDAAFDAMVRNEDRIRAVWRRIREDERLREASAGMAETWASVKALIPRSQRKREISSLEAAYLRTHPDSGYLTEILPLKEFPDYLDYLPKGSIVRKIGVMGALPDPDDAVDYITLSPGEYAAFVEKTAGLVIQTLTNQNLYTGVTLCHQSKPSES